MTKIILKGIKVYINYHNADLSILLRYEKKKFTQKRKDILGFNQYLIKSFYLLLNISLK